MQHIRNLFDPNRGLDRKIEKVITYAAAREDLLRAEISEYVVTASIEDQLGKLLDQMRYAMEAGGQNEVGVWVSGFYGSGKSSFTKYLGFSFDERVVIDGRPFVSLLQDRLGIAQTRALLATVAKRFPAAVVMLDLASEMLAGATMEDVSTVLYYKVLEWAGYSRNLKVAALERRVEKDGRMAEFEAQVRSVTGMDWQELQNDPLSVDALVPQLAHQLYPAFFPTESAFSASTEGFYQFETDRVREMIELVRRKSGKEHILFIIDEVGQYVASRNNLILNLDGLAKNLKGIGDGKVWIVATAQQTLTEDDPRAALNSGELFKLQARFPIQIDLPSTDIKEICNRRLLAKSAAGEQTLSQLFDAHGQALRHNTRLQDAKSYGGDLDRSAFINLYPFLPAHFEILLNLLSALAKSTGGVGLRSAIKVIQDILIEGHEGQPPVADQPLGRLATTVTLYDALITDIVRAFPSVYQAARKTCAFYADSPLHQDIAKTVAVLQILGNLPTSIENIASLLQPAVDAAPRLEAVRTAAEQMVQERQVPLTEKEGTLGYLSEKLNDIDQERAQLPLRSVDVRNITSNALREGFDPLPRSTLQGTFAVTAGLKVQVTSSSPASLAGETNPVQMLVRFADPSEYDAARATALQDSRERQAQHTIFLLGRSDAEAQNLAEEIYRCQRIEEQHRNAPDQEVRDYLRDQIQRADRLKAQLRQKLLRSLAQGSFVFRGQATAAANFDQDVREAARKQLAEVAEQVFDRYGEAPLRVTTDAAEKFLRQTNLAAITTALDPLSLVLIVGGKPQIQTAHRAIVSIRDFIERSGTVYGKVLSDHFAQPPFGWSPDTLRYILSAMLMAGELSLTISGRGEVTAVGQYAIDALKTNKSLATVGVALRGARPPMEVLARAGERLTQLTGESVIPLETDISKAAVRQFPRYQQDYGPLGVTLTTLGLAGAERVDTLTRQLRDMLLTDASDAPMQLGAEQSVLYEGLQWAAQLKKALEQGLEGTIRELQRYRDEIEALPNTGIPGQLRTDLAEALAQLAERLKQEDFYRHGDNLNTLLGTIQARVGRAVADLAEQQKQRVRAGLIELEKLPEWTQLTEGEHHNVRATLENLLVEPTTDLKGLKSLLNREYDLTLKSGEQREQVRRLAAERRLAVIDKPGPKSKENPLLFKQSLTVPGKVTSLAELDALLATLQALRLQLPDYDAIDLSIEIQP